MKIFNILSLCGMVTSVLLGGCKQKNASIEFQERSDYYTRGIGVYPGEPREDFSPSLRPDYINYRNIALFRSAYHSSCYDYNLTAQLVTDGIVCNSAPHYLQLSTPEGDVPRREREWLIDRAEHSRNMVKGSDTYFSFGLKNWRERVDKVQFRLSVAYNAEEARSGYEIIFEGLSDAGVWTELANLRGKDLPGEVLKYKVHSDPNKNSGGPGTLPVRMLNETLVFSQSGTFATYRMRLKMEGAVYWNVFETNFYYCDEFVDLLPSKWFDSVWMSATIGEEWIYVDLGTSSEFDKVELSWINKAIKGKVQVSNDAKHWTDLAVLPGGKELVDVITVKGIGRYVRVVMSEPANNERYMLSEIRVMGRGGLIAEPMPCLGFLSSKKLDKFYLSGGGWMLQRSSLVSVSGEAISHPSFVPERWIIATVPGTVLTSYKNIGAIPNPNYADNLFQISESFFNSNFWYRNEFEIPDNFIKEHLFLNFDGINWKANIFLNGQNLGRIEGAFTRGVFDVTELLVPGKNVLAVEVIKNAHIGAVKEKYEKNTDFNGGILGADNPTFHASIGWDWISTIRGRNIGIWNDVYLTSSGEVTVHDPFVRTILPLPDTTSAQLIPEVIVKNHKTSSIKGLLKGRIGDIVFEQLVQLQAGEERTIRFDASQFTQLNIQNPHLWWPRGYGAPYLYDANFTFVVNDRISDSKDFKVGIRQMTFNEDCGILNLFINGRRFIGRGGNWGFGESNLNFRGREYDIAVAYHADMNFTMIRNWVGQIGDEELYEACDRHGIMIWQDFWLANPADGPDPSDSELFIANAEDYVKRFRNHASIGIYCGRNEGFPPIQIDEALRRFIKEYNPGTHYISSSADGVVSGHGPYRALSTKEYFKLENGRDKFHTERGMPNVMTYEGLVRTLSPDALWPQNGQWGQHDYTMEGAQSCASFNAIIEKRFGKINNIQEFTSLAQWVNYDGYRGMFESRSLNRQGLLLWMTHSAWPSMVWQTYDYYFEPTAAYFGCKKASEPLHIQWNPVTDNVEVVNYSARTRLGLKVMAQIVNMDNTVVWEDDVMLNSWEDTTNQCMKLKYPKNLSAVHFIKLTLLEKDSIISDNFYVRGIEEDNYEALRKMPKVTLQSMTTVHCDSLGNWVANVTIKNTSSTPVLMIRVNVLGENDGEQFLPIFYSDNYFSLLTGEEKKITIRWKDVDTRGESPKVVLTGYNVEHTD